MTIGMTYRYIYLLLDIIQGTYTAIKSRAGYITSTKPDRKLLPRLLRVMAEIISITIADIQRNAFAGYTGEPKVIDAFHVRTVDSISLY